MSLDLFQAISKPNLEIQEIFYPLTLNVPYETIGFYGFFIPKLNTLPLFFIIPKLSLLPFFEKNSIGYHQRETGACFTNTVKNLQFPL